MILESLREPEPLVTSREWGVPLRQLELGKLSGFISGWGRGILAAKPLSSPTTHTPGWMHKALARICVPV